MTVSEHFPPPTEMEAFHARWLAEREEVGSEPIQRQSVSDDFYDRVESVVVPVAESGADAVATVVDLINRTEPELSEDLENARRHLGYYGYARIRQTGIDRVNHNLARIVFTACTRIVTQSRAEFSNVGEIQALFNGTNIDEAPVKDSTSLHKAWPHTERVYADHPPKNVSIGVIRSMPEYGGRSIYIPSPRILESRHGAASEDQPISYYQRLFENVLELTETGLPYEINTAVSDKDGVIIASPYDRYGNLRFRHESILNGITAFARQRFDHELARGGQEKADIIKELENDAHDTLHNLNSAIGAADRITITPVPGDMIWYENLKGLHGRSAYRDPKERFFLKLLVDFDDLDRFKDGDKAKFLIDNGRAYASQHFRRNMGKHFKSIDELFEVPAYYIDPNRLEG